VPHWFNTPSSCFSIRMHLEVFPTGPGVDPRQKTNSPLLTFRPTRRYYPIRAASLPEGSKTCSPEVPFPSAHWKWGATNNRAYLTRLCCALRLFQPLSALIPPASVTALFHAAGTPGILPFRAFPSLKAVAPLDARFPHDVTSGFRPVRHGKPRVTAPFPFSRLQGVALPASPFT
jgi:hypothetical protein